MFDFVLTICLFLPGILLLTALSKLLRIPLSTLEKILFGGILWLFVFTSTSIIVGLFSSLILPYFALFSVFSVLVATFSIIYIIRHQNIDIRKWVNIDIANVPYIISFFLIFALCFLVLYFHSYFFEWDAISLYLPSAKAIISTGGVTSQPYFLLNFFDTSPIIPIIYAWILNFSSTTALYDFSLASFLLTLVAIYLISRKFFSKEFALIAVLIFMSFPAVLITIGSRALYLDIPFVLFFMTTLYLAIKLLAPETSALNRKWFNYAMFFISFNLLLLTRIELGLFVAPAILAVFILLTFNPNRWEIFLTFSLGLFYYIREGRNILLSPSVYYLGRLFPIIIVSIFFFILIKKIVFVDDDKHRLIEKKFLAFGLLTSPFIIYMIKNGLGSGFIIPGLPLWNSEISRSITMFNVLNPSSTTSLTSYFRWDYLLSVWWLIPPLLIPFLISLVYSVVGVSKRVSIKKHVLPILLFFTAIFLIWITLSCDSQPRRLYYFAPFISIMAVFGLSKIKTYFSRLGFALRVATYLPLLCAYVLTRINAQTVNTIASSYAELYQPKIDFEFIAVAALLFYLVFTPYERIASNLLQKKFAKLRRKAAGVTLLVLTLNVGLFLVPMNSIVNSVYSNGYELRFDYNGEGWLYYPDVIQYYNQNITDDYVTLGYFNHELITFANRSIIDLSDPIFGMSLYPSLSSTNVTEITNLMKQLNIYYFLQPKTNNPYYSDYQRLTNSTVLGEIFNDNPNFRPINSFKYAVLYKFYEDSDYTLQLVSNSTIYPWNFNSGANYSVTVENNSTCFSSTTNSQGELSLMFIPDSPIQVDDALKILVKSYGSSQFFVTLYSNVKNRTTDMFNYRYKTIEGSASPLIFINEGETLGHFNPAHIEGVLIGIKTEPLREERFEISGIYIVKYNK